ncbi:MAG: FAD-binding oxidoreductase [Bacteroidetes bacterium]|nr:MAG: FAD-binding oxidoreductase [Bacteroidota bacterium]
MRCLIVGQGIAGSVLAWTLRTRGVAVDVCDAEFPNRSSSVAAGIINPVTGKRYVKSWRFDSLYPFARALYLQMEAHWKVKVWHDQTILRILQTPGEVNDWTVRMAAGDYAELLDILDGDSSWDPFLATPGTIGIIRKAARVDFPMIMASLREDLVADGHFIDQEFSPGQMEAIAATYDRVIYCEGFRGAANPYFPDLGWQLAKGEAMVIRLEHPSAGMLQDMLKKTLLIAPLGDNRFWVGGSYNWTFEDNGATPEEQQYLEERLRAMIGVPYSVEQRMGAVRPTVKDRRPLIGRSPVDPRFYLFNGLGTKGALLAPYWAAHLTDHLLEAKALDPEVDIVRFGN